MANVPVSQHQRNTNPNPNESMHHFQDLTTNFTAFTLSPSQFNTDEDIANAIDKFNAEKKTITQIKIDSTWRAINQRKNDLSKYFGSSTSQHHVNYFAQMITSSNVMIINQWPGTTNNHITNLKQLVHCATNSCLLCFDIGNFDVQCDYVEEMAAALNFNRLRFVEMLKSMKVHKSLIREHTKLISTFSDKYEAWRFPQHSVICGVGMQGWSVFVPWQYPLHAYVAAKWIELNGEKKQFIKLMKSPKLEQKQTNDLGIASRAMYPTPIAMENEEEKEEKKQFIKLMKSPKVNQKQTNDSGIAISSRAMYPTPIAMQNEADKEEKDEQEPKKDEAELENPCRMKFEFWLKNTVKKEKYLHLFAKKDNADVRCIEFLDDVELKTIGIDNNLDRKLIMKKVRDFVKQKEEFMKWWNANFSSTALDIYQDAFECNGILTMRDLLHDINDKEKLKLVMFEHEKQVIIGHVDAVWNAIQSLKNSSNAVSMQQEGVQAQETENSYS